MSDAAARTVEDYLVIFHEDSGMMTMVTLNAYASIDPTPEFVRAAIVAMDDDIGFVRSRGAQFLGIAKISSESDIVPTALWFRGELALNARLKDSEKSVRLQAALGLGRLAPTVTNAQAVFPVLHAATDDPETERYHMRLIASAVACFASVVPEQVAHVVPQLLSHSDSEVVCFGLEAISQCGAFARPLLSQIKALGKSRSGDIRDSAKDALKRLEQRS